MPPRFAYWTILIDNTATAFRARDREELLPTVTQLKRTNDNVELKWFAQNRLWDSPEAQRESWRKPKPPVERRGRDWRPGGAHQDPRARFDKKARPKTHGEGRPSGDRPWKPKPRPDQRPNRRPEQRGAPHSHGQGWRPKAQHGDQRGWRPKPQHADQRGWRPKPPHHGPPRGPHKPQPHRHGQRPPQSYKPWNSKPNRKRRDDEPPDQQ